jgi:hypothetical protein
LESFLKNIIHEVSTTDVVLKGHIITIFKNDGNRINYKGGQSLFKALKVFCGSQFSNSSNKNLEGIKFREFWDIISSVRHTIIHSGNRLEKTKLKSPYHHALFTKIFPNCDTNQETILIKLSRSELVKTAKLIAEFGLQIYKLRSEKEQLETDIIY